MENDFVQFCDQLGTLVRPNQSYSRHIHIRWIEFLYSENGWDSFCNLQNSGISRFWAPPRIISYTKRKCPPQEEDHSDQRKRPKAPATETPAANRYQRTIPPCKCIKSKCCRRYCICFAANIPCCTQCSCITCNNTIATRCATTRVKVTSIDHCNCKMSHCQKKYCPCHAAGKACSEKCSCCTCYNT
jgi:hypothetical protein